MKCEDCGEMFMLPELQFKADGMVPNTHIKKYRAQCKECATQNTQNTQNRQVQNNSADIADIAEDDHEYPF